MGQRIRLFHLQFGFLLLGQETEEENQTFSFQKMQWNDYEPLYSVNTLIKTPGWMTKMTNRSPLPKNKQTNTQASKRRKKTCSLHPHPIQATSIASSPIRVCARGPIASRWPTSWDHDLPAAASCRQFERHSQLWSWVNQNPQLLPERSFSGLFERRFHEKWHWFGQVSNPTFGPITCSGFPVHQMTRKKSS